MIIKPMVNNKFWILLFITSVFTSSCSDDTDTNKDDVNLANNQIANINLSNQLGLDSGEVKMFTMPTPLQAAATLKIMEVDYSDHLLLDNNVVVSKSDIDLSLALGMYMTDLGYTTIFNNTQKSLSYANDIQHIMDELPIGYYVNDAFKKSFKDNLDNQDSLCKIILEGYNDANQYISETENEGIGLLILTGSFIEGLYLVTSSDVQIKWVQEHHNILIQQKLFIDNFILLLKGYTSNPNIAALHKNLLLLKIAFDKINIYFDEETESYKLKKTITVKDKEKIKTICSKIRNEIIVNLK